MASTDGIASVGSQTQSTMIDGLADANSQQTVIKLLQEILQTLRSERKEPEASFAEEGGKSKTDVGKKEELSSNTMFLPSASNSCAALRDNSE